MKGKTARGVLGLPRSHSLIALHCRWAVWSVPFPVPSSSDPQLQAWPEDSRMDNPRWPALGKPFKGADDVKLTGFSKITESSLRLEKLSKLECNH